MAISRRRFFADSARAGALALLTGGTAGAQEGPGYIPDYEQPLFQLHRASVDPVRIASIDLLRHGSHYFVRSTAEDGRTGIVRTKQIENFIPILLNLVVPYFVGKDARDLEALIDGVYIRNYKLAGQAFWCPVAYVEQSLFDLLGKVAGKTAAELMGGIRRQKIPVYLSGSGRSTTAEEEVRIYDKGLAETGARAVKFKIGGRMSRNRDAYPGRTRTLMELARKTMGPEVIIYADANGSYNAARAIEIGKWLESLDVRFFEEPCPWEELSETRAVADALSMPVAAGEQDGSLWRFQWMIQNRVMDIAQPDLNYNGGFIRAARVARMARQAGIPITPHNTQTGPASPNILHFAAAIENTGPFMEYPYRGRKEPEGWYSPRFEIKDGSIEVPTGPGLGLEIDPGFLRKAETVGR